MTDLERELRDLARHLDIPPAPSFAGVVATPAVRDRRRSRLLLVAAAAAVAALAVAFAVPASRASLLQFFHIRGATVTIVERLPPITSRGSLGVPVGSAQAPFRLLLPSGRKPDAIFAGDGGYWLRYRGLLLFEFESAGAPILKKVASTSTPVEYVRVDGEPGIWIGGRHVVYLPGGPLRSASNVLVWQHGPLTLRLEAAVGLIRALAVARTVR